MRGWASTQMLDSLRYLPPCFSHSSKKIEMSLLGSKLGSTNLTLEHHSGFSWAGSVFLQIITLYTLPLLQRKAKFLQSEWLLFANMVKMYAFFLLKWDTWSKNCCSIFTFEIWMLLNFLLKQKLLRTWSLEKSWNKIKR